MLSRTCRPRPVRGVAFPFSTLHPPEIASAKPAMCPRSAANDERFLASTKALMGTSGFVFADAATGLRVRWPKGH